MATLSISPVGKLVYNTFTQQVGTTGINGPITSQGSTNTSNDTTVGIGDIIDPSGVLRKIFGQILPPSVTDPIGTTTQQITDGIKQYAIYMILFVILVIGLAGLIIPSATNYVKQNPEVLT